MPLAPAPEMHELAHTKLCYDRRTYCGHPRQGIFRYFGDGELIVGHNHAPCDYEVPADVRHDLGGYHSRAKLLLQRSLDGGRTWPPEDEVVVYDETQSTEAKRQFLTGGGKRRPRCDMFSPESVFFFGRTYLPEDRGGVARCFALRSADKGRTWENTPTIVRHPDGDGLRVHKDCHPVLRMPDGKTLLAAMSISDPGAPAVYRSRNNGLTWQFLSRVAVDRSGIGRFTYTGLLLLPGEELHCYFLHIASGDQEVDGLKNAICMAVSSDGGKTWGDPTPIVGEGASCWRSPTGGGNLYRSPWPLVLDDGRILVLFARRRMPMGIGGTVSADGGKTWSREFVIRDDGTCPDLGYPVGCQLEDGRVFVAYYFTEADGNAFGGTRHMAASTFRVR